MRDISSIFSDFLLVIESNSTEATSESFIIFVLSGFHPLICFQNLVDVGPISAWTTLIFFGLNSSLNASVNPFKPNLDAQYADQLGNPIFEAIDPIFKIKESFFSSGRKVVVNKKTPVKFVSIIFF